MIEHVSSVDVLVNNAAVLLAENEDVLSITPDDYRHTFETNLFGVIEVCRAFVPGWRGRDTAASSTCRQVRDSSRRCLRMRRPTQYRRPRSTHSRGFLRTHLAATESSQTWSIQDGCARIWVVPRRHGRRSKARTRLCGLPRFRTMVLRADYSGTAAQSNGRVVGPQLLRG
jgi:NAD(P)-dependent dehydrogenase (short-subunit alcohol dehydrogenase family)